MKRLNILRYARVSGEEQKKNETIDAQVRQIPIDMERQGLLKKDGGSYEVFFRSPTITNPTDKEGFFFDDGFNLETLDGTHQIDEILRLIQMGLVQAIFVDSSSRILRSKNAEVRGKIINILDEYDVKLFDYTGEITRGVIMEIVAAVNADEKAKIARRTQSGKIRKAKNYNAPVGGNACYGYSWDKRTNTWNIVEEEAKWIRWIAHLSVGQECRDMPESLRQLLIENPNGVSDSLIVQRCNEIGFNMTPYYQRSNQQSYLRRFPKGEMKRSWIQNQFCKERHAGKLITYLKDVSKVGKKRHIPREEKERIEIKRPAIISEELARLLAERRRDRAMMYGKNVVHKYLVRHLIYCGHCDYQMSARPGSNTKNGKTYFSTYYVCPMNKKHLPMQCPHRHNHNTKKIDPIIWDKVKSFLSDPNFVIENTKMIANEERVKQDIEKLNSEMAFLEQKKQTLQDEVSQLVTMLRKGTLSEKEFLLEKENTSKEATQMEGSIARIKNELNAKLQLLTAVDHVDLEKTRRRYEKWMNTCDFDTQVTIVKSVVSRVYVYSEGRLDICFKAVH